MVPITFVVAAALPGVHIMPCLQPKLPTSRSPHLKRHYSAVQGFSLYPLDALQAKKSNDPPKRGTCPSHFSECQSQMVRIPVAVTAAPPRVHIIPSLQPELPTSRSQHFKCHHTAVQGFSLYPLMHCKQKKAINSQSVELVPEQFSECPSPMVAIPFVVAVAPPGVHRMPCFQPKLPISRSQHFKRHQSAVQGFSLY